MKIYISAGTPGASCATSFGGVPVTLWEKVCHSKEDFLWIRHEEYRMTSRWGAAKRKRPFIVEFERRGKFGLSSTQVTESSTLAGAVAAAKRYTGEKA